MPGPEAVSAGCRKIIDHFVADIAAWPAADHIGDDNADIVRLGKGRTVGTAFLRSQEADCVTRIAPPESVWWPVGQPPDPIARGQNAAVFTAANIDIHRGNRRIMCRTLCVLRKASASKCRHLRAIGCREARRMDGGALVREEVDFPNLRGDFHLRLRCQQRGVPKRDLYMLLDAADRLVPVGGGRVSLTLSRVEAAALRAEGLAVADLERARRRALVVDADGHPITVITSFGRYGRRYRHGIVRRRRARR
jgi:hypothetical protein